jgi:ATP-dependent RNA helicase DeaD
LNTFNELGIKPTVSRAIEELGFKTPSPIQAESLPILMGELTDFVGLASTGTGKTAAFGIGMLQHINPELKKTQTLVICPTRELANQVCSQLEQLSKHTGIRTLAVYGGASYGEQIHFLEKGPQIVVGTPGRVIDHIERGTLELSEVKIVVLDEADEMLSMGFKEEMESILKACPNEEKKIWLFSATMDQGVKKVTETFLKNPKRVQTNRSEVVSINVDQIYYPTREGDKPEILCKLIENEDNFYGIVFCQTKLLCVELTHYLTSKGYQVDSLHGDKDQSSRERTMKAFREKKFTMLICTDVAARGIDVKDISHVVNYSLPREMDVYVHRIGRTARIGTKGVVWNLVTPAHRPLIGRIEKTTKSKMREGKIPSRKDIAGKKVASALTEFLAQKNHKMASDLLSNDWILALAPMSQEEIVGRFMSMIHADIFKDNDIREKPLVKTADAGSGKSADRPPRSSDRGSDRRPDRRSSGGGGSDRRFSDRRESRFRDNDRSARPHRGSASGGGIGGFGGFAGRRDEQRDSKPSDRRDDRKESRPDNKPASADAPRASERPPRRSNDRADDRRPPRRDSPHEGRSSSRSEGRFDSRSEGRFDSRRERPGADRPKRRPDSRRDENSW